MKDYAVENSSYRTGDRSPTLCRTRCTDSAKLVRHALLLFYRKVDLEAFLQWMSLVTKYAWSNLLHYDQKSEQYNYILTVHHTFGKRWSYAFSSQMREAVKDIAGVSPKTVATDNTLMITIPKDAKLAFKQQSTSHTSHMSSALISA